MLIEHQIITFAIKKFLFHDFSSVFPQRRFHESLDGQTNALWDSGTTGSRGSHNDACKQQYLSVQKKIKNQNLEEKEDFYFTWHTCLYTYLCINHKILRMQNLDHLPETK